MDRGAWWATVHGAAESNTPEPSKVCRDSPERESLWFELCNLWLEACEPGTQHLCGVSAIQSL